jgi:hypothetical protein
MATPLNDRVLAGLEHYCCALGAVGFVLLIACAMWQTSCSLAQQDGKKKSQFALPLAQGDTAVPSISESLC